MGAQAVEPARYDTDVFRADGDLGATGTDAPWR